jgi:hypothetical protein
LVTVNRWDSVRHFCSFYEIEKRQLPNLGLFAIILLAAITTIVATGIGSDCVNFMGISDRRIHLRCCGNMQQAVIKSKSIELTIDCELR